MVEIWHTFWAFNLNNNHFVHAYLFRTCNEIYKFVNEILTR